jgi:nitroreductase
METWDALRSRRDVRAYTDEPIREENLQCILEAGRRAPSSNNTQPWDFVVVTDRGELAQLADATRGRHVATSAATIALVAPVPSNGRRRTASSTTSDR